MKRKLRILSVGLIIILMILSISVKILAVDYSYKEGYIWGFSYTNGPVQIQLKDNTKVYVAQSSDGYMGKVQVFSILEQPNVYCIQKGLRLGEGFFDVGRETTVTDPILKYILYHGTGTELEKNHLDHEGQIALWHYLQVNKDVTTGDAYNILQGWKPSTTIAANDLYNKAVDYANEISGVENQQATIDLKLTGNTLNIKIRGSFYDFNLKIGSVDFGKVSKTIDGVYEKNIDIYADEGYINEHKITVEVVPVTIDYTVSYRVLTNTSQQNMLVVTKKSENGDINGEKGIGDIQVNTDVSLQKYITKVTDAKDNITYQDELTRKNKYAREDKNLGINNNDKGYIHEGKNVSKNNMARGSTSYKYDNPVKIKAGDTVEYTIIVYNNSSVPCTVDVKDEINSNGEIVSGISNGYIVDDLYLEAYSEKEYKVYIKYPNYFHEIVENKAYIDETTPENKKEYRTYDEDYVKMEEYKVSLEKYVKSVSKSSNLDSKNHYTSIAQYIKNGNNIDDIVGRFRGINNTYSNIDKIYSNLKYVNNLDILRNLDFNKDGKIDGEDIGEYTTILENHMKTSTFQEVINNPSIIENYVKADINNDGVVNDKDLEIYKFYNSNLHKENEKEEEINKYDLYKFELNRMYKLLQNNTLSNSDLLPLLKIKILNNNNLSIEEYIKSDVTGDGIVDSRDIIVIKSKEEYEWSWMTSFYDINGDSEVNYVDRELVAEYEAKLNGKYSEIFKLVNGGSYDKFITDFNAAYKGEEFESTVYDLNGDAKCTAEDKELLDEYEALKARAEDEQMGSALTLDNIFQFMESCDVYVDDVINRLDEEIVEYYQNEYNNSFVTTIKDENILKILEGKKLYNSRYLNMLEDFDLNLDSIVDGRDIELYNKYNTQEYDVNFEFGINAEFIYKEEFLDYIKNYTYIGNGDIDKNGEIDTSDYTKLKNEIQKVDIGYSIEYDLDCNGLIDEKDLEILNKLRTPYVYGYGRDCISMYVQAHNLKEYWDINSDGIVDNKDYVAAGAFVYEVHTSDCLDIVDYVVIADILDIDCNGIIDNEERKVASWDFLYLVDGNGNGKLDKGDVTYIYNICQEYEAIGAPIPNILRNLNSTQRFIEKIVQKMEANKISILHDDLEQNNFDMVDCMNYYDKFVDINGDGKKNYDDYKICYNIREIQGAVGIDLWEIHVLISCYLDNYYPASIDADLNLDGKIDNLDLEVIDNFIRYYGEYGEQSTIDQIRTKIQKCIDYIKYDINRDGRVDNNDCNALYQYINTTDTIFDIDNDGNKFSEQDLQTLNEYVTYFETHTYVNDNNDYTSKVNGSISDIINEANRYIYYLDISGDRKVTQADIDIVSELKNKDIENPAELSISEVNNVLSLDLNGDSIFNYKNTEVSFNDYNKIKAEFDLNKDSKLDTKDYNLYIELKELLATNPNNYKEILNSEANTIVDYEDERKGKAEYLTIENGEFKDYTENDTEWTQHNYEKYNNVVTVTNGDYVTYRITVKNDGESSVYISEITDWLPNGVEYSSSKEVKLNNLTNRLLLPGETASVDITVKVTEPNISLRVLKNTAKITKIKNSADVEMDADSADKTPYNNMDSDYIQLEYLKEDDKTPDVILAGNVWNDIAKDKAQNNYNGKLDVKEKNVSNVKVMLYRITGYNQEIPTTLKISEKYTDGGYYSFANTDINKFTDINKVTYVNRVVENKWEQYIKAPKNETNNRWNDNKEYYSYYIVFEYDGITYTSTFNENQRIWNISNNNIKDNVMYSNAAEDFGKPGEKTRESFNSGFATINNKSGIEYTTVNEEQYIPQSSHNAYNKNGTLKDKYKMTSSTDIIKLSDYEKTEEYLKYINLGLRGRDIFDLELTSDVHEVEVTINNQVGVYKYSNKVDLRQKDLTKNSTTTEDMANKNKELSNKYVDTQEQNLRNSDYNIDESRYTAEQGISNITVTYKITVQNTSCTNGTATVINNYYDMKYTFKEAYLKDGTKLGCTLGNVKESDEKEICKYVSIETTGRMLKQSDTMEIFVVYTLNKPITETLAGLSKDNPIPTFNMAEITEYKTECADGQTEYTRGLIDKDSAPGSVYSEKVRLTKNATSTDISTLSYYFRAQDLQNLKYEDDTYAAPVLYFVIPYDNNETPDDPNDDNDYGRRITGVVFEDKTTVDPVTRIKTGNGVLDEGETPVYGAVVHLIEIGNNKVVDVQTTNEEGKFEFKNFLPGEYIIKYYYGKIEESVLLNKAQEGINSKSYNGEDFQSTNNIGTHGASKLNETENFWYVYNETERVSTAADDSSRRITVSNNVTAFIDEQMTVLNNMRNGLSKEDAKVTYKDNENKKQTITVENIIDSTYMFAETDKMLFTVEETVDMNTLKNKDELLAQNKITITDEGRKLGQWTIFPNKDAEYYKEYHIENMNFGIAEVPVTKVNLQKDVQSFTITDSTGQNIIAKAEKDSQGKWIESSKKGNVKAIDGWRDIQVEIEDERLQGARLEIKYNVSVDMNTEINFDGTENIVPTITGIVDFVNNNLSYNESLGDNAKYWEITTYDYIKEEFAKQEKWDEVTKPEGTVDPEGKTYSTILKAKIDNPLLLTTVGTGSATITLEKVLSSSDANILSMIVGKDDTYEYYNTVEIIGFDYSNTTINNNTEEDDTNTEGESGTTGGSDSTKGIMRDRIRNDKRFISIPGVQYDYAVSETISINPPTGDTSINTIYYVIAIIGLIILAGGVFSIKKFVLKK